MNNPEVMMSSPAVSNKLSTLFLYYVLSPVLCAFTGFHLMSYVMVGLYTWPRTSRTMVLMIGTGIFVYEFIFKSLPPKFLSEKPWSQYEWVLYMGLIPFVCGVGVLVVLAGVSE